MTDEKIKKLIKDAEEAKALLVVAAKNAEWFIREIGKAIDLVMAVWETEKAKNESDQLSETVDQLIALIPGKDKLN